ncbi:type VI secretion system-associated protein TagO [Limnobaculum xujianqingii]|uniref:type VI secretion system-associated protein TagO n=1 Tax=Limnobaculum xujianqingii TaxID=2738837 RepID=UPI0015B938DC|nr:type VI secretion system-associated protein TagO [Limnobaculum xujianqingii]
MVKVLCPLVILLSSAITMANAEQPTKQDDSVLLKCQSVTDNDLRLQCYDSALPPNKNPSDTQSEDVGKWQVRSESSPVDDSENVFLALQAEEPIKTQFGKMTYPVLILSCKENQTDLIIQWDSYLGLGQTDVLHRLDKQKAESKPWVNSTDNEAVFYQGDTVKFIKQLTKGQKFYTQVTPYSSGIVSATFTLTGLAAAIKPLQKACKWK